MGWIYLIIALVALGGGGYGVWTYNGALEARAKAESRAKEFEQAYGSLAASAGAMQKAINDTQQLADRRASRAAKAEEEARRLNEELENAKRKDPAVATWAKQPVPDAVRLLLDSSSASTAGPMPGPDSKPRTNTPP